MNEAKASLQPYINKSLTYLQRLRRYSFLLFLVLVFAVYGFLLYRSDALSHTEPTQDQVSSQVKAANIPHIDQSVVKQLESLQDNSVSVKALFNQARSNPFQ